MTKVVTANRLTDGAVVFLGAGDVIVESFDLAALLDNEAGEAALARLLKRETLIADAYLIDADRHGPVGRAAVRESIRRCGPTARENSSGDAPHQGGA